MQIDNEKNTSHIQMLEKEMDKQNLLCDLALKLRRKSFLLIRDGNSSTSFPSWKSCFNEILFGV